MATFKNNPHITSAHSIRTQRDLKKDINFGKIICDWFDRVKMQSGVPCLIVHIDICNSSFLKDIDNPPRIKSVIKDIIGNIAIDTYGEPFNWAGDGGALIFQNNKKGKMNCFEFCNRIRWLTWKKLLNQTLIKHFTQQDIFSCVTKSREEFKFDNSLMSFPERWGLNYEDKTSSDPNILEFRIVCMDDTISFSGKDKTLSHGIRLNHLLKYEREIGLSNAAVLSQDIKFTRQILERLGDSVMHPRKLKPDRDNLSFRISPPCKEICQREHYKSLNTVTLIDVKIMQDKISQYLRERTMLNAARIYNISPFTLLNSLSTFWMDIMKKCGTVELLMPEIYHCRVNNQDMHVRIILERIFKNSIYKIKNEKSSNTLKEIINTLNDKLIIKSLPLDKLEKHLGFYYAFSLYFEKELPTAGALAFLMEPFSLLEKIDTYEKPNTNLLKLPLWRYEKVIFNSDSFNLEQFQIEADEFNLLWKEGDDLSSILQNL